jgi:uncharacterized membrane protein HdeD (DUF308 family)
MLSSPKQLTFWIAVALAIIGLIFFFVPMVAAFAPSKFVSAN